MQSRTKIFLILILTLTLSGCSHKRTEGSKLKMQHKKPNHLINEKSPYLLQHAYNPVDWYPWSKEAFEKAEREDKPIFLSIGYSTCHWCHVMEHESFEDTSVAEMLNENFVAIKVDREERPDVDKIYMNVCHMISGNCGWPLTIIMTPDKKPFFAATYLPKEDRGNRIGLLTLLERITYFWQNDREKLLTDANKVSSYLQAYLSQSQKDKIDTAVFHNAFIYYKQNFDEEFGGFGYAPKFPSPHNLIFLMHYRKTYGNNYALEMVEKTLDEMRKGGIFDQIGFGFHRYSTDRKWLVPHFEKMLYDQAMLVIAYTEAYQITKKINYKKTAEEILDYVSRVMKSGQGGFYSAEDADSEGEEGKFYLWREEEIDELLDEKASKIFKFRYGITPQGNFHNEITGISNGENIIYIAKSIEETADKFNLSEKEVSESLENSRQKLFNAREKRKHPFKDDKILTDWNALMISAFAKAGNIFNNKSYIEIARKSVEFINNYLRGKDGSLLHRYRNSEASIPAYIDDYAFFIEALINLYEATFETKYLFEAKALLDYTITNFWDEKNFGFYFSKKTDEENFPQSKEYYDGAIPSGNSVMMSNLIRIARLTSNERYENLAYKLSEAFASLANSNPSAYSEFLTGLDFLLNKSNEIIIVSKNMDNSLDPYFQVLREVYLPNKVVLLVTERNNKELYKFAPFLKNYSAINSKPTVYVCENYTCSLPVNNVEQMKKLLNENTE